jgi:hypothetical protein
MKKLFLTLAAMAVAPVAFAQVEIGLKVSPSISYFRASSPSQYNFQGDGAKFSLGGGIFVDYFFGQNYAFNTGLFLTGKGGSYSYHEPISNNSALISQKLAIQYLEVPATIKLFTNEVAPDVRLYFQVGGSIAFPVGSRINGDKYFTDPYPLGNGGGQTQASDHVLFVDANLIGGVGAEYQLGQSTKLLVGLSYHHGLVNLDRYFEKSRGFSDVSIKNSVFALDLGIKF